MTWLMAIIYPIVVILIIDEVKVYEYFTNPGICISDFLVKKL